MKLEPHPFLKDFPMMPSHEIDALAADIKKFGQRVPIVIYGGKILDGHNRYEACKRLKIEPRTAQFTKANPKDYAVSVNFFENSVSSFPYKKVTCAISTYKRRKRG